MIRAVRVWAAVCASVCRFAFKRRLFAFRDETDSGGDAPPYDNVRRYFSDQLAHHLVWPLAADNN